jgi:hypothetical protein
MYLSDTNILCHVVINYYRNLIIYKIINNHTSYFDYFYRHNIILLFIMVLNKGTTICANQTYLYKSPNSLITFCLNNNFK